MEHFNNRIFRTFIFLFLLSVVTQLRAQYTLSGLSDSLDYIIRHKEEFVIKKEKRIDNIKQLLNDSALSLQKEYEINLNLHNEYMKFNVDSAIYYTTRNVEIATAFGDKYKEYDSQLKLSRLYSMGGMYRKAEQILKEIPKQELSRSLLADYYECYNSFWEYYSTSTSHKKYTRQQELYLDSLLVTDNPLSFRSRIKTASQYTFTNPRKAEKLLKELLATEQTGTPDYAIITCSLAMVYRQLNRPEEEKKMFMLSAITDMWNATRENFSLQSLALIYYQNNELDKAFKYTQSAVEDAIRSGIQFRATQMYGFYSVISAAYQKEQSKVYSNMQMYLTSISIFSFILILLLVYLYIQMKRNIRTKEELFTTNQKLHQLNQALNRANEQLNLNNQQLLEVSSVKEQYIAQFFDLCSNYIDKMEEYKNSLYKLAINRKYEQLIKQLKSTATIDEELNTLYTHFDSIFLGLYPNFVNEVNELLVEEERIVLKNENMLNKELRIYALLRLGINDGGKIANFLRCSTSTIYNYRTKMRNKAIDRNNFESQIMQL